MFFKGLKEKSILKAIKKENNSRELLNGSSKIKSVGFIVNTEEIPITNEDLNKISASINAKFEAVLLFTKINKKTNLEEGLVSPNQIGWKAVFKVPELKEFQSKKIDLLITLSKEDNLYVLALNTLTKADFKVCISEYYESSNDLSLNIQDFKLEIFITELKKYLTILKKI